MRLGDYESARCEAKVLDDVGFSYNFDREVYVNRRTMKIFGVEFVEDHDEKTIERCVREDSTTGTWRLYFNSVPSASVRRELEAVLA